MLRKNYHRIVLFKDYRRIVTYGKGRWEANSRRFTD